MENTTPSADPTLPGQDLPRNKTVLARPVGRPPKTPVGLTMAKKAWADLHGHKFARNAGRLGRKGA